MQSYKLDILILHFDDTYFYQPNLCSIGREIDLRSFSEIRYMCSFDRLKMLDEKIPSLKSSINFLGRGDYHYLTYLFVKRIKYPISLLVIDNHWDGFETFENYISCGSWILEVKKLKNVKNIVFINSREKIESNLFFVISQPYPIYISIDKDILSEKYLRTSWKQGDLSILDLYHILSHVPREKIVGIDVCGEPAFNILEYEKSERINLEIIKIMREEKDVRVSA